MKKIIIFIFLLVVFFISAIGTALVYYDRLFPSANYSEELFLYSVFSGLLGSAVYMIRGFYYSTVEKDNPEKIFDFNRWIWWYLSRPILGAIAGAISFIIIYLAFDLEQSGKNQLVVFLAGFLVGYNFHEFIERKIVKKIEITN